MIEAFCIAEGFFYFLRINEILARNFEGMDRFLRLINVSSLFDGSR